MKCVCAIFSCVASPTQRCFSTLSHKGHDFRKKVFEFKMFSDFLYNLCLKHSSFYEELSEMIKDVYWYSCKVPLLFLLDFNETWIFWQILEKYSNIKFHENLSSGSRFFPCGQTDRTKLMVAFCSFANAHKNWTEYFFQVKNWKFVVVETPFLTNVFDEVPLRPKHVLWLNNAI